MGCVVERLLGSETKNAKVKTRHIRNVNHQITTLRTIQFTLSLCLSGNGKGIDCQLLAGLPMFKQFTPANLMRCMKVQRKSTPIAVLLYSPSTGFQDAFANHVCGYDSSSIWFYLTLSGDPQSCTVFWTLTASVRDNLDRYWTLLDSGQLQFKGRKQRFSTLSVGHFRYTVV